MIKLLFIILFFITTNISAEIYARFETGKATHNEENILAFSKMDMGYIFNVYDFKNELYGGYLTWFKVYDKNAYNNEPFREIYTFGYKMKYDVFYLKYEHFCNHAVYSHQRYWLSNKWGENMTSYSIGIEIKIK